MPIDKSKYPPNWKEISDRIRNEAGQCCEECGIPNGHLVIRSSIDPADWLDLMSWEGVRWSHLDEYQGKPITVRLTVAHLNHDTTDNRDENLKALCQRCHLLYDLPVHVEHARATRLRNKRERAQAERFKVGQLSLFDRSE